MTKKFQLFRPREHCDCPCGTYKSFGSKHKLLLISPAAQAFWLKAQVVYRNLLTRYKMHNTTRTVPKKFFFFAFIVFALSLQDCISFEFTSWGDILEYIISNYYLFSFSMLIMVVSFMLVSNLSIMCNWILVLVMVL